MAQKSLERRVEVLEKRVDILEQLPERVRAVELQIVQLREDLRGEFSALRAEIRAGDEDTRRVLRDEMRELFADNQRQMRILHEDVIARIATIRQG
ncbi:MAG: hypothetical protein ABJA98_28125 [Acidobacteriota bacterium]